MIHILKSLAAKQNARWIYTDTVKCVCVLIFSSMSDIHNVDMEHILRSHSNPESSDFASGSLEKQIQPLWENHRTSTHIVHQQVVCLIQHILCNFLGPDAEIAAVVPSRKHGPRLHQQCQEKYWEKWIKWTKVTHDANTRFPVQRILILQWYGSL